MKVRNKYKDKLVSLSKRPKSSNLSYLVERGTPDNTNIHSEIRMNTLKARMDIHSRLKIHICNVLPQGKDANWRLPDLAQIESTLLSERLISKEKGWYHTKDPDHMVHCGSRILLFEEGAMPPPFFDNHMVTRT